MKTGRRILTGFVFCFLVVASALLVFAGCSGGKKYKLTVYHGESIALEQKISKGKSYKLSKLSSLSTLEGYEVVGVYDNPEFEGDPLEGSVKMEGDKTLYVKTERLYLIMLDDIYKIYAKPNEEISMPSSYIPTRPHARIIGFGKGNETYMSKTSNYILNVNDFYNYTLKLYAVWENASIVTLNYNDGSKLEKIFLFKEEKFKLPSYNARGKYVSSWVSQHGVPFDVGDEITTTKDIVFRATLKNCKYTLNFVSSKPENEKMEVEFSQTITLPLYTFVGTKHVGWILPDSTTLPAGSEMIVPDFGPNGEVELKIKTKLETYNFKFAGFENFNREVTYGTEVILPTPQKNGYTFTQWKYNGKAYKDTIIISDMGNDGDEILFDAEFKSNAYTLKFEGEGVNLPNVSAVCGNVANIPSFSKTGYRFSGWECKAEGVTITTGTITTPALGAAGTKILTPILTPFEFVVDLEGTAEGNMIVRYGETINLPDSVKAGHTFKNWKHNDKVLPNPYTVELLGQDLAHVVFTPVFEPSKYTLNFLKPDGTQETIQTEFGQTVVYPLVSKPFHEFVGWTYLGEIVYKIGKVVTPDLGEAGVKNIVAKFDAFKYTFVFDKSQLENITADYGSTMTLPSLKKTGFKFLGFEYNGRLYTDKLIVGDFGANGSTITLTPKFEAEKYTLRFECGDVTFPKIDSMEVMYGQVVQLPYPRYENGGRTKVVSGWYTDAQLKNKITTYTHLTEGEYKLFAKVELV